MATVQAPNGGGEVDQVVISGMLILRFFCSPASETMEDAYLDRLDTIIDLLRQIGPEPVRGAAATTRPAATGQKGGNFLRDAQGELKKRFDGAGSDDKRWLERQLRHVYRLPSDFVKRFANASAEDMDWFYGVIAQSLANGCAQALES